MEGLHEKSNNAGISVDGNTLCLCCCLCIACCRVSAQDSRLQSQAGNDRKEIINLGHSKYETLGKLKGSSNSLALRAVGKGGAAMEKEVERHMGVEKGLEKERKATVTSIQTVEPGKRRFL